MTRVHGGAAPTEGHGGASPIRHCGGAAPTGFGSRAAATGRPARSRSLLALVAALLVVLTGCAGQDSQPSSPQAGGYVSGDGRITTWDSSERDEPVELTGTTYEKEDIDLADWRGDVVVVNFWYASCPPCRAEAPDLAELATKYKDQDVHFLGVNHTDGRGTALAFQRQFDIPYPSLNDTDADGVAAMQGVVPLRAMPSTVVLDREGRVAARVIGQIEPSTLRALIEESLEGQK
ncbi:MAG TPA: TlpA disulfide reductase family protein [Ruania sp.]|nr:TlpA disulfide reductase family protein [Ruania sp.]